MIQHEIHHQSDTAYREADNRDQRTEKISLIRDFILVVHHMDRIYRLDSSKRENGTSELYICSPLYGLFTDLTKTLMVINF